MTILFKVCFYYGRLLIWRKQIIHKSVNCDNLGSSLHPWQFRSTCTTNYCTNFWVTQAVCGRVSADWWRVKSTRESQSCSSQQTVALFNRVLHACIYSIRCTLGGFCCTPGKGFGLIKLLTSVSAGSVGTLIIKLVQVSKACFSKQVPPFCGPPPGCYDGGQVECLNGTVKLCGWKFREKYDINCLCPFWS